MNRRVPARKAVHDEIRRRLLSVSGHPSGKFGGFGYSIACNLAVAKLNVNVEGKGGSFTEQLRGREIDTGYAVLIETLDEGMQNGDPSVRIIVLANKRAVIAQVSLRSFQLAAVLTLQRYGDVTGGGLTATFNADSGKANIVLSEVGHCAQCLKEVPSSCVYCYRCGNRMK